MLKDNHFKKFLTKKNWVSWGPVMFEGFGVQKTPLLAGFYLIYFIYWNFGELG